MPFHTRDNVSIVTAILPPATTKSVIDGLFETGEQNALMFNARGTLIRNHWYQSFLPVISPELEYLQLLVPDNHVDQMIDTIIRLGRLHLPGSGAVYSVPCETVEYGDHFNLWSELQDTPSDFNASVNLKENLTAIFCVVQEDQVESITRAAMNAGAHGPVVFFSEGKGLRDRLGWLRITKKTHKEVVTVIVDNIDKIAVTEAMIDAGRIGLPGRGFLYRMPVDKGLVNLASQVGNRGYTANMHQIIAAIDGIQGSTDWRDQSVVELAGAGKGAGIGSFGQLKQRNWLVDQMCLGCIVSRKNADVVLESMLVAGASGANVSYAKFLEVEAMTTSTGLRLSRESGIIRCIIARPMIEVVKRAVMQCCEDNEIDDVCTFVQTVGRGITYVAPDHNERMTRGLESVTGTEAS